MDKREIEKIRREIELVLKEVGERNGMEIKISGGIIYYETSFKCGIEGVKEGAETEIERAFKRNAKYYKMTSGDLGKKFLFRGRTFKILGWKTRNSKYPVVAEEEKSGMKYKFTPEVVSEGLEVAEEISRGGLKKWKERENC